MKTKLIFLVVVLFSILNIKSTMYTTITKARLGQKSIRERFYLCSTEDEILSTTQTYTTYQWYKQEWTGRHLITIHG